MNPADIGLAKRHFPGAEIVPDETISGGMDATAEDGAIRVMNTFEKRLERAWREMLPLLIKDVYQEVSRWNSFWTLKTGDIPPNISCRGSGAGERGSSRIGDALAFDASPFDSPVVRTDGSVLKDRSPEGVWRNLMREYRWVYLQMNRGLRRIIRAFFLYVELRTLFICLRHGKTKRPAAVEELLSCQPAFGRRSRHILVTSVGYSLCRRRH